MMSIPTDVRPLTHSEHNSQIILISPRSHFQVKQYIYTIEEEVGYAFYVLYNYTVASY